MMSTKPTLQQVNAMTPAAFTHLLGGVFEHSPWVAERAASRRPFASIDQLHAAMVAEIEVAGLETQLRLIRAHPELAGKAAVRGELTQESTREQSGAGLNQCSPEEFARLQRLNTDYNQKFGHPFIVAVRGHTRQSIIDLFEQRLSNRPEEERAECLQQIYRIGRFRLDDMLA
jgi:2-oxo-4-hydroxy-4-carboxy-5-ureidoimidazoline decarboxylase